MHVSLTERLEEFVKEKVESGLYNNSSEVVREALRLLEHDDQIRQVKLESLKEAIRIGDDQYARGEFCSRTVDEIIADKEASVKKARK